MKLLFTLLLPAILCVNSLAQESVKKAIHLSSDDMNERIEKRDFRDVPDHVREFHARGTILLKVEVDKGAVPTAVIVVRGLGQRGKLEEYVAGQIMTWKFKPLIRNGEPTAYRGVIYVVFCYG